MRAATLVWDRPNPRYSDAPRDRWYVHRAALRDRGLPHTKEAAMVKWMGPKWGADIIQECLVLHGHYGWGNELPHLQRMIDVMGLQIGDGTAHIMKTIIARETIGPIGVAYK